MEEYLRRLASLLPGPLRPVAGPVVDRLIAVWRWPQSLAVRVRGGWGRVRTASRRLRDGAVSLGGEAYTTLRWLAQARAPALARWARDRAIAWASARVVELRSLINAARAASTRAVGILRAQVLGALDALRRWATGMLSPILTGLGRLLVRVFNTWATPARLAAWLAGAMWTALWRHAESNLDRLAETIWSRRRRITLATIDRIEAIVRHVL